MADNSGRKKSGAEARVERLTWGLLVLIFALLYIFDTYLSTDIANAIPNWFVPMAGAVVLLGSGLFQYGRRWRVSPVTWIGGMLLLMFALFGIYVNSQRPFLVESLIVTLVVILFGTFAGET
jgi:hypothetical protein